MGYTAVEQAIKWCQGEETDEFIEVPVEYMDKDNIQDFIDREKGYGVEVEQDILMLIRNHLHKAGGFLKKGVKIK